ncbi:MAG: sigma-54-dependent Fis family transcriptional regulator [Myxococcales bacterium]|nr:sigma-54-dependent Fis family transcriptional regulator [Myxococcales bacterium]
MSKTEENAELPWERGDTGGAAAELRLVIVWSLDDPARVGESAAVRAPCELGRGPAEGAAERVVFEQQRPGSCTRRPPLDSPRISRRQLVIEPAGADSLRVRCVGQPGLLVNGEERSEAVVGPGDTLRIRNALSLWIERRPAALRARPSLARWRSFPFGHADAHGIVGESERAWLLREQLASACEARRHVLLLGESGVGKELAARALHEELGGGPLVSRNAATFPSGLVDAELFGTARGYPNAGSPERVGLVAEADGGTLFLDEIGELPEELQARLLRVMDSGEHQRLGESGVRSADIRLIGATNRELSRIKHDVLARFTVRVTIPPLDERRADIPLIARALLEAMAGRNPPMRARFWQGDAPRLDPALVEALVKRKYTHHARELEYFLFLAASTSYGNFIALGPEVQSELESLSDAGSARGGEALRVEAPDRAAIEDALAACNGSTSKAAARLGLPSRFVLYRLMKRLGVASEEAS